MTSKKKCINVNYNFIFWELLNDLDVSNIMIKPCLVWTYAAGDYYLQVTHHVASVIR